MTISRSEISLSGQWRVKLGGMNDTNIEYLNEEIKLPGTLEENKIGNINSNHNSGELKREFTYEGPAVYERTILIPDDWAGKTIKLSLERTKPASVYIDGCFYGSENSISTSQIYDVTSAMQPGKHTIAIEVDNASGIMNWSTIRNSHAVSDSIQTNWNGILGMIKLQCFDHIMIDSVKLYPDIVNQSVKVSLTLEKFLAKKAVGHMIVKAESFNSTKRHIVTPESYETIMNPDENIKSFDVIYRLGEGAQLWDEFNPALYKVSLCLNITIDGQELSPEKEITFGMREFGICGSQFAINHNVTFLRGKHDACLFPLTGYTPMDVESWVKRYETAKSYGINHYRFHSCCPPEAAFIAADLTGIYIQPELPIWSANAFVDDEEWSYYKREALRIIHEFGNHPSFVMFAWGNELVGSMERMLELIDISKKADPRHLYSHGSNNFLGNVFHPFGVDYWCTMWTEGKWDFRKPGYGGKYVRGSFAHHTRGHINNEEPSTMQDYSSSIAGYPMPVIGHEAGQYQIHPDFKDLDKYKGVLKPVNLEIFKENLENNNMLNQAEEFFKASGALSVICYREEIEAAMRTLGFGGFQLLDLQDFPAQGTALVGILDSFMESKGLIEPQKWKCFCSETIPLLRMSKYVWKNNEVFEAKVEIVNYGPQTLNHPVVWKMSDRSGRRIAAGMCSNPTLEKGKITEAGEIKINLAGISEAEKLTLHIEIENTVYKNEYGIWVYPADLNTGISEDIKICNDINEAVSFAEEGRKVLLMPHKASIKNCVEGAFIPDFWCYSMFKKYSPPGTLGILCDPDHPAFNKFPTEYHSNWQWWNIVKNSKPIILDDSSYEGEILVQVIDNIHRQHKLGMVFEGKIGAGKIILCAVNLLELKDKPEANQLLYSLISYMKSENFNPVWKLSKEGLKFLLENDSRNKNHQIQKEDVTDFFG